MNILPKLVVTDIDGVWTDGGMYYDEKGNELKKFHTYDSAGVLWLKKLGIPLCICTGETTLAVERRATKLKVEYLHQGIQNKVEVVKDLCLELGIELDQVAYIGDDINDLGIMREVGFSACPKSAPVYIQEVADVVLTKNGGEGVFREFVEGILGAERLTEIISGL